MTRRVRIPGVVVAAGALLLLGVLLGRAGRGDVAAPSPSAAEPMVFVPPGARPRLPATGHRVRGYPRSRAGALSAAADFAALLGGPLVLEPARYRSRLASISTPAASARLKAGAVGTAAYLEAREGLLTAHREGGAGMFRTAPVAAAVDRFSRHEATVRVWFTTVFGKADGEGVRAVWGTSTIRLRWLGDWRLDGWENTPGPTPPQPGAPMAESAALLVATAGMQGFRYAPGP